MAENAEQIKEALHKAVAQYAELGGLAVEVGLPSDRIHTPSGKPLSVVGAIHEFGLHGIPERSFLRGAVMNNKADIKNTHIVLAEKAAKGEDANRLMEQFALWGQGFIQDYMSNGKSNFVPLDKPRKDGSDNPLNDTGALKQGIIGVVVSD